MTDDDLSKENSNLSLENILEQSYNLTDVRTLELRVGSFRHPVTELKFTRTIQALFDLTSLQHLNLGEALVPANVLFALLGNAPHVTHLTIPHILKLEKLDSDDNPFRQIKTLTISSWYGGEIIQCGNGIIRNCMLSRSFELFFRFFTCIEHLDVYIDQIHQMTRLINKLQYLKSGTFKLAGLQRSVQWSKYDADYISFKQFCCPIALCIFHLSSNHPFDGD